MDVREVAARLAGLAAGGLPLVVGVECDPVALRYALASWSHNSWSHSGWAHSGWSHGTGPHPVAPAPYRPADHGPPSGPQPPPTGPHPAPVWPGAFGGPAAPAPVWPGQVGGPAAPAGQPHGGFGPGQPLADAGPGQPPTGQSPTSQPPTGQAPTSQPPSGQPPTNQSPTSQPPTGQAPTSQSPTGQSPASLESTGVDPMGTWGPPGNATWARGDEMFRAGAGVATEKRAGAIGDTLHAEGADGGPLAIRLVEIVDPADFLFTAAGYRLQPGERSVVVHTEVTNRGPAPLSTLPDLYLVLLDADGHAVSKAPVALSSRPPHRLGVKPGEMAGGHTVYVLPEATELAAVRWSPGPDDERHSVTWTVGTT